MNEELLFKYVCGTASDEEKIIVLDWIDESEENAAKFAAIKNNFALSMFKMQSEREAALPQRGKGRRIALSNIAIGLSVAAILAVMFLGVLYLSTQNKDGMDGHGEMTAQNHQVVQNFEYSVNPGVKGTMTLPDGSVVVLNSSSRIVYPQQFGEESREVYLDGEGWFEVVSDKSRPMLIKTSKGLTVKVTGTSFNLSSYKNDAALVATLVEGEISISGEKIEDDILMSPREEVEVDSKAVTHRRNVDPTFATYWKEGILAFNDNDMGSVINKIERWYGVEIRVKDPAILNKRFTAKFKSESINQVLNILRISSGIKYSIHDNTVTLSLK